MWFVTLIIWYNHSISIYESRKLLTLVGYSCWRKAVYSNLGYLSLHIEEQSVEQNVGILLR